MEQPAPEQACKDDLTPLFVPVPQNLAEVVGYEGDARYLGIYWNISVDDVAYDDGDTRGVGESLRFLQYAGHPSVECELGDLNIGLFDQPADTWLILDTHAGNLYSCPSVFARTFLIRQHRHEGPTPVDELGIELAGSYADVLDDDEESDYAPVRDEMREYLDDWGEPNAS